MLENEFNHGFLKLKGRWPKFYNDHQKELVRKNVEGSGIGYNGWLTVVDWLVSKHRSAPLPFDVLKTCKKYVAKSRRPQVREPVEKKCGDCLDSGILEVRVEDKLLFCRCHSCKLGQRDQWGLPVYNRGTGLLPIVSAIEYGARWTPVSGERGDLLKSPTVERWIAKVEESKEYWGKL